MLIANQGIICKFILFLHGDFYNCNIYFGEINAPHIFSHHTKCILMGRMYRMKIAASFWTSWNIILSTQSISLHRLLSAFVVAHIE